MNTEDYMSKLQSQFQKYVKAREYAKANNVLDKIVKVKSKPSAQQ